MCVPRPRIDQSELAISVLWVDDKIESEVSWRIFRDIHLTYSGPIHV
jgi:hypothetical protein